MQRTRCKVHTLIEYLIARFTKARQTDRQKEIDMYIKIVGEDESWSETYQCQSYRVVKCDDGIFLRMDDKPVRHEISCCDVYVMNDNGKTIERLR